jgi:hypothetical protein
LGNFYEIKKSQDARAGHDDQKQCDNEYPSHLFSPCSDRPARIRPRALRISRRAFAAVSSCSRLRALRGQ